MRDANGLIPQINENSSSQNNSGQRLRIQISQRREEENEEHANNDINNSINIE